MKNRKVKSSQKTCYSMDFHVKKVRTKLFIDTMYKDRIVDHAEHWFRKWCNWNWTRYCALTEQLAKLLKK